MAHYDCSNCGESMGIGFGECSSCTPAEYHQLLRDMRKLNDAAQAAAATEFQEARKALDDAQAAYVLKIRDPMYATLQQRLHELKMKHYRGYRYEQERLERTRMDHPTTGEEIHVEPGAQIPLFPDI